MASSWPHAGPEHLARTMAFLDDMRATRVHAEGGMSAMAAIEPRHQADSDFAPTGDVRWGTEQWRH